MGYELSGKIALVTGASAGIGAAIAVELGRRGCRVGLVARRRERLEEVAGSVEEAGGEAAVLVGDVTRDDDVGSVVRQLRDTWGRVDVLVNNAGTGLIAPLEETPVGEADALFDLNVLGMVRTLRAVVPAMLERGSGAIVQMSSGAGLKALPLNGIYTATKFAVTGLTEALRLELAPRGIQVHCVFPVGTETEFLEASRDHVRNRASRRFFRGPFTPLQTPEKVARATVRGIERGTPEIYPYRPLRLLRLVDDIAPRLVEKLGGLESYRDRLLSAGEAPEDADA